MYYDIVVLYVAVGRDVPAVDTGVLLLETITSTTNVAGHLVRWVVETDHRHGLAA